MVQTSHPEALAVRFWGVRGSIAAPGAGTRRYGGNTPCVEVRSGTTRVILDAGTGIRPLGEAICEEWRAGAAGDRDLHVFLTHYHWDHVQGLPFFQPLFDPGAAVALHGPLPHDGADVRELALTIQLGRPHFPLGPDALAATVTAADAESGWQGGNLDVQALRVPHTDLTLAYRVGLRDGGGAVAYVPDCELGQVVGDGGTSPVRTGELVRFLEGVDLLIHDAMYSEEEYVTRGGWGHSTPLQALDLAAAAGVRQLRLFHHAPWRDDHAVAAHAAVAVAAPAARDAGFEVAAAMEGECLVVGQQVMIP
jgi:phosphoribosyl 1,2-cyclic phosphodiesterase